MDLEDTDCHVKYLIRDRDGKYPALFDTILADAGIGVMLSGVRMPRMNGKRGSVPGAAGGDLLPAQVTTAFHLVAPRTAVGRDDRLVLFTTRVTAQRGVAIVDQT